MRAGSYILWCFHLALTFSLPSLFLLHHPLAGDRVKQRVFQIVLLRSEEERSLPLPRKIRGWLVPRRVPCALHLRGTAWAQQPEPVWNPAPFWAMFNSSTPTCLSEAFLFLVDPASQILTKNPRL